MDGFDWLIGSSEPNWIITSIFGALLGVLFAEFGAIVAYPVRRLKHDPLERLWHQFNYTHRNGKPLLNKATLEIRKGLLGGLRGGLTDQSGRLTYRGTVRREAGHVVAELKGESHEETLVLRFIGTIVAGHAIMPGIWMAYDRDAYPAAGGALLCEDDIGFDRARDIIGNWLTSRGTILRVAQHSK